VAKKISYKTFEMYRTEKVSYQRSEMRKYEYILYREITRIPVSYIDIHVLSSGYIFNSTLQNSKDRHNTKEKQRVAVWVRVRAPTQIQTKREIRQVGIPLPVKEAYKH
jgi:hypothetical protein